MTDYVPRGAAAIRAHFLDAQKRLEEADAIAPAPDPNMARDGIKPGQWPGFPAANLPPVLPFEILGRDDELNTYVVTCTGHLYCLERFNDDTLTAISAPRIYDLWWAFPGWGKTQKRFNKDTGEEENFTPVKRLETKTAMSCIVQEAARKPPFDPQKQHRGRGGWASREDRFIWHSGRYLWMIDNGELVAARPTLHEGYLYTRAHPTIEPWQAPLPKDESPARRLLGYLMTWNWQRPWLDPILVVGWLVTSLMGAALKARPVIFTRGGAGVGKSTLHELIKGVLENTVFATADTTAAGIYQHIGRDSLPVLVDEIENKPGSNRAQSIIELARIAYSGADGYRGGQNGDGTRFTLRCSFFLSAINPPHLMPQDLTRTAMLDLEPLDNAKKATAGQMQYSDQDGRVLLRQIMDGWPEFRELQQRYHEGLISKGLDARAIDTYGTLMAAAHMILGEDGMAQTGLKTDDFDWLTQVIAQATEYERSNTQANWHKAISRLMQATIDGWKNGERLTVGGVLQDYIDQELELRYARERLYAAGLTVLPQEKFVQATGPCLLVPTDSASEALNRIFADTVHRDAGWVSAIRQAPKSLGIVLNYEKTHVAKINGESRRCLVIDVRAYQAFTERDHMSVESKDAETDTAPPFDESDVVPF